jgi:hypothetical protein
MAYPGLTGRRLSRELRERGYRGGYTAVTDQLRQLRPAEHTRSKAPINAPIHQLRHSGTAPRSHHPPVKSKACWQRLPARFNWDQDVKFSGDSLPTPAWDRGIRDRHGLAVAGQRVTPSQESSAAAAMSAARTCRSRPRSDRGCLHRRLDRGLHSSCIADRGSGQC